MFRQPSPIVGELRQLRVRLVPPAGSTEVSPLLPSQWPTLSGLIRDAAMQTDDTSHLAGLDCCERLPERWLVRAPARLPSLSPALPGRGRAWSWSGQQAANIDTSA